MYNKVTNKIITQKAVLFLFAIYTATSIFTSSQMSKLPGWNLLYDTVRAVTLIGVMITFMLQNKITIKWFTICICTAIILIATILESKNLNISLILIFIIYGRYIKSDNYLKWYLRTGVISCSLVVLLSLIGVFHDNITTVVRGERYTLGFNYTTFSANYFFHFCIVYIVLKKKNISLAETILILSINRIIYNLTLTRAVYYEVICLVAFLWVCKLYKKLCDFKTFEIITIIIMPLMCVLSIYFSYNYTSSSTFYKKFNEILSGRLTLGNAAIKQYGFSLFGTNIKWETGIDAIRSGDYLYVDSSYLNTALNYGLVILILLVLGFSFMGYKAYKERKYFVCVALIFLAIHSFSDPQLFLLQYNPLLIMVGVAYIKSYELPIGNIVRNDNSKEKPCKAL